MVDIAILLPIRKIGVFLPRMRKYGADDKAGLENRRKKESFLNRRRVKPLIRSLEPVL